MLEAIRKYTTVATESLYYTYAAILKNEGVRTPETDQLMKSNMDNVVGYISKTITEKAAPTSVRSSDSRNT